MTPEQPPRTALLIVHQGFVARYLLRTDILRRLLDAGVRTVVLAPNWDEDYLRRELDHPLVTLAPLRAGSVPEGSRIWSLFFFLRQFTLARGHRATTLQGRYANHRDGMRRDRPLVGSVVHAALSLLWRSRPLRQALLATEDALFSPPLHADVFDEHSPDLVVATSAGWFLPDAVVLREARRRGIATASLVLAWDNPSSKGYRGATPDAIVTWSDRMAEEVAAFHDLQRDHIRVGGVPHFDPYVRPGALPARSELFDQIGLDEHRKLVVFAARSPASFAYNLAVAETLARAVAENELGHTAQLVVRPHPIALRSGQPGGIAEYHALAERCPHVHVDVPEVLSQRLHCDTPISDSRRLAGLIEHADVLVNAFSTTSLEAFLVDTPVVLASAESHVGHEAADASEPRAFDEDTHIQPLIAQGAARVAESPEELVALVRAYLERPDLDREARAAAARSECGPTDGRSGERIGGFLLELLGLAEAPAASEEPASADVAG